ncbi:MAG: hypothetical protein ABIS92_13950 [Polyangia bacterium]
MSDKIRCVVCGAERERVLTVPLPCQHSTLEDTFGPMPALKVPSLDEVFGPEAGMVREAREILGTVEGLLKAHAEKFKSENPDLWQTQIEGVRAELTDPKWCPRSTLKPILRMVSSHIGTNRFFNLLPHYPSEYERCADLRNALMHDDWTEVQKLGGARAALTWGRSLKDLVDLCVNSGGLGNVILSVTGERWQWPVISESP